TAFRQPWSTAMFTGDNLPPGVSCVLVTREKARGESRRQVVGYCCLWIMADELQIANLAVIPTLRRQGIGRRLVAAALAVAAARGVRRAFLEVRAGNDAAQALYRRFGFSVLARRRRYYSEPREDALIMRLDISPTG
ncbi:MAG: ribosomal protein S18-alanine N-acetyltransferase, partial [Candidatus Methylomirabilales bacterium]